VALVRASFKLPVW